MDFHPPKHISHNPGRTTAEPLDAAEALEMPTSCLQIPSTWVTMSDAIGDSPGHESNGELHMTTHRPTTMYWFGMEVAHLESWIVMSPTQTHE